MAGILSLFVAVVTAAVCLTGVVAQKRCFPDTKSDCSKPGVEGWTYFSTMQYKYFPKRLSQKDADAFCKQWSSRVCSNRMVSALGSFVLEKENDDGILAAYRDAAITSSGLFWTGVRAGNKRAKSNQLYYTDGSRTARHGFGKQGIPDKVASDSCVAQNGKNGRMTVRKCSDELGFVCKIAPRKH